MILYCYLVYRPINCLGCYEHSWHNENNIFGRHNINGPFYNCTLSQTSLLFSCKSCCCYENLVCIYTRKTGCLYQNKVTSKPRFYLKARSLNTTVKWDTCLTLEAGQQVCKQQLAVRNSCSREKSLVLSPESLAQTVNFLSKFRAIASNLSFFSENNTTELIKGMSHVMNSCLCRC